MNLSYFLVKSKLSIKSNKFKGDSIDIEVNDILTIHMDSLYPIIFKINEITITKTEATFYRQDSMFIKGLGWSISSLIRLGELIDITKSVKLDKKINDLLR